jgi:Beta-carotene isomerase D27-like, C-terminal
MDADIIDWTTIGKQFLAEIQEVSACLAIAAGSVLKSSTAATTATTDIVALCDEIDGLENNDDDQDETTLATLATRREPLQLRRRALEFQRYQMLVHLMQSDYAAYTATASFLSPSRIPRQQLPNVQDVAWNAEAASVTTAKTTKNDDDAADDFVADCALDDMEYQDSVLDKLLLSIFRKLVEQNTDGVTSDQPGIEGLLDQGRQFMLQANQTSEAQHEMVEKTLGGLMTPVLPPFYRIFMSGIIPSIGTKWDGKQLGPWFYAPLLTSIVTPTFFAFLVGPSRPNRRQDGRRGGLLVEKCKFLQQSNCKGLCLHQCKLPAQQFFQNELGLSLTVTPNFVTQECQWSFGQEPLPPEQDPSFPRGCLVGCQSRQAIAATTGTYKDLCN